MNKLLPLLLVFLLSIISASAITFPANGTILANDCAASGNASIPLNLTTSNCMSLASYREISCSSYPVLNISQPYEIRFSSDSTLSTCRVKLVEYGASNSAVSFGGSAFVNTGTTIFVRGIRCVESTTSYEGVISFDASSFLVNGTNYGSNILKISPSRSTLLKSVVVECSAVNGSVVQSISKTPMTERNGTSDIRVALTKVDPVSSVKYTLVLKNVGSSVVLQKPDFCSVSTIPASSTVNNTILFCNISTTAQTNLSFAVKTPYYLEYTSTISYTDGSGVAKSNSTSGNFTVISDISAEPINLYQSIEFYTARGRVNPVNITYNDRLLGMYVHCDASASGATVVVRNVNRHESWPCSTNQKTSENTFFIDLINQNTRHLYGRTCPIPFVMNRSGLYEFELTCNYNNSCTGTCYNPFPATNVPTTFADWTEYLLPGKVFLSFYNNNAIPDCVCNDGAQLKPINIINMTTTIAVEALQR